MSAAVEPPATVDVGRFVRAQHAGQVITRTTEESLIPGLMHADHTWTERPDGSIIDSIGRKLDGAAAAEWCRRRQVGKIAGDVYGRLIADDPAVAAQIADQVAELVRRDAARVRRFATKSLERCVAERLTRSRVVFAHDGALWWRWSTVANPIIGNALPGQPTAEPPAPAGGPAALVAAFRRPQPDGNAVTVDIVRSAVRDARLLQAHESEPDWGCVLAELRTIAGLPAASGAPAPDSGPATRWLLSRANRT